MAYNYRIPLAFYVVSSVLGGYLLCLQAPYVFVPPKYHELKESTGIVQHYPKMYEHAKWQGIYIQTAENDGEMFFCDFKKKPLFTESPRADNPILGKCDSLGLHHASLIQQKISVKSHQQTIYELKHGNQTILSYEKMLSEYRERFISQVYGFVVLWVVGLPLLAVLSHFYVQQLKQHQEQDDMD